MSSANATRVEYDVERPFAVLDRVTLVNPDSFARVSGIVVCLPRRVSGWRVAVAWNGCGRSWHWPNVLRRFGP